MTTIMTLYSELRRRNVLRVAAAYIVSAWLLIQIAETIFPLFGFDDGPARIVVIVMVIGFLPALIVSWIFELTPAGLQKEKDVDRSQATVTQSAKKFDRITMLVLVLAVSYFAFDKFVLSESREKFIAESARQEGLSEALLAIKNNKSIAVLPFVDMSPNQDQEYFADGIAEELLNELAQLEGLNVAGRTSSFSFKGSEEDLKSIGEQLSVTNILEGSVRKDGNDVRITAQLINSQTGFHLWSDTYDRRIDDIFYIQEDIARSVAGALSIALDVEGRNDLPGTGTSNVEAYNAYLEGRARGRVGRSDQAAVYFQRAIDIDPNYAEAWAFLGAAIGVGSWNQPPEQARATQERGRELVVRATEIDPNFAEAYGMLSSFQWTRGDWVGATEFHQIFSAVTPADIPARIGSANIFARVGRVRAAIEIEELIRLIDPLSYYGALMLAEHYAQAGRYSDARAVLEKVKTLSPATDPSVIMRRLFMAMSENEPGAVREFLEKLADANPSIATIARSVLAEFDSPPADILHMLHRVYDDETEMTGEGRVVTASMAAYYGDPELALESMTEELRGNLLRTGRLWYPFFSDMRKLPGFKVLADEIGFVAYWRTYGWADTCRPLSDDDFECN